MHLLRAEKNQWQNKWREFYPLSCYIHPDGCAVGQADSFVGQADIVIVVMSAEHSFCAAQLHGGVKQTAVDTGSANGFVILSTLLFFDGTVPTVFFPV